MTKKSISINKGGRPTKYKEEYCQKMIDFFSIDHTREVKRTKINKDGSVHEWYEEVANKLPTFEAFAVRELGVHVETLINWKNQKDENGNLKNVEFFESYNICKNLQKDMLNNLAMLGFYNAAYTKFVAINITDMRDVHHNEHSHNGKIELPVINVNYTKSPPKTIEGEIIEEKEEN